MKVRVSATVDLDTLEVQYLVEPASALFADPQAFGDAIDAVAAELMKDAPARRRMVEAAEEVRRG